MTDDARVREIALLPCPFCGFDRPETHDNVVADMSWVACGQCGLEAPSETGVTKEQAVRYWNTRAIAALPPQPVMTEEELAQSLAAMAHNRQFGIPLDDRARKSMNEWIEARWKEHREDARWLLNRLSAQPGNHQSSTSDECPHCGGKIPNIFLDQEPLELAARDAVLEEAALCAADMRQRWEKTLAEIPGVPAFRGQRSVLESAISGMKAVETAIRAMKGGGGWQPIETAPKDGSRFLGWPCHFDDGTRAAVTRWYEHPSVSGWITPELDCGDYEFSPTHWMPLPDPPTSGESS